MHPFGHSIIVLISLPAPVYFNARNELIVWRGTVERCIELFHMQLNHEHDADRLVFAVSQDLKLP